MRVRWAAPIAASAVLVLAAPLVANIQRWLRGALGGDYVLVVNLIVAASAAACLALGAWGIRERRPLRYGLIAAALAIAAAYAWWSGLASAESNAVERFHFVAYGVIVWLFYRAARPAGDDGRSADVSLLIVPVVCALVVSTADEWLQHLVPGRIGELRDIVMNLAAIGCGLLVSLAVAPPGAMSLEVGARARRPLVIALAAAAIALAGFVYAVHVGSLVADGEVMFRSRYDAAALTRRAAMIDPDTPPTRRWIEDQYATEAIWHVQARNASWDRGDVAAAWGEQRILEKYYAPVLAAGHDWPAEQRADAGRRAADAPRPYTSHAERLPIWVLPH